MAELLAQILNLPEAERWVLAQAILDSLKPTSTLEQEQIIFAEASLEKWESEGGKGLNIDELTKLIEQKRAHRN